MKGACRAPRGFTLIEALVALTLLALVLIMLLVVYEKLVASFKRGANAAGMQQNVRVTFWRLVDELRMAGVGHDPDGDTSRPDEMLEGIWSGAVTFRADLDGRDPARRYDPELALGGPAMRFGAVTTGNDEIVTYALGVPSGRGTSISFSADVRGVPRDGLVETMTITRVHLSQVAPPYTLYRMTVSQSGSTVLRRPVAEGIHTLSFSYFDRDGVPIAPVGGGDGPADIAARASVDLIGIRLVGLAEGVGSATYTLETRVHLRGRKVVGGTDFDPDRPAGPAQAL